MHAGRDSSITEAERKSDLSLENIKTSIVSRDDEMINVSWPTRFRHVKAAHTCTWIFQFDPAMSICMQVRVQLPGKATQKIFDEALTFLARDAPPVPGFRKSKGGTEAPHNLSSYDGILAWHLRSCFLTRIILYLLSRSNSNFWYFFCFLCMDIRWLFVGKTSNVSACKPQFFLYVTLLIARFPFCFTHMHSLEDPKCKTIKERFINLQNMRCSLRYPILFFWNKSAHYCLNQLLNQTRVQAAVGN